MPLLLYICRPHLRNRESSSAGRARPCQGRGRGFESRLSLKRSHLYRWLFLFEVNLTLMAARVVE